jgi:hypothetical protein
MVGGRSPTPRATASEQLGRAFEGSASVFELLRTVRSRRVGLGYRVDSGSVEHHPVTGRLMSQKAGPNRFVSAREPVPLSEVEEALIAWAACGPNGIIAWDVSLDGGFGQLVAVAGRTAPEPNNSLATDLLIVNDRGTFLYKPGSERSGPVEMEPADGRSRYDRVLEWYRRGTVRILDGRPDIDWAMRDPKAPHAPLNGPHQYNLNRPGSTWFLPITDVARLHNGLPDLLGTRHVCLIDDFRGGRPAGLERWIGDGRLERPVPLSAYEQDVFRNETYPAGCMVQNVRLAAEALGLGTWCLSGYDADLLFGARPELSPGLGFHVEPNNPKAPLATGRLKVFGIPGVKEATYVPSPRFPDAEALVRHWYDERYGPGGWAHEGDHNLLREGAGPWKPERIDGIVAHPSARLEDWAWEATTDYIRYCVGTYGQWPVTYNPMQAGFGVIVHHVDADFYDRHYREGYVTDRIRTHFAEWH